MANMALRPRFASPISSASAPSNSMTQVGEAWMPSLRSMPPQRSALRCPSGSTFGAAKSEMPRVPGGASGSRASTRCSVFAVRSCSPQVMKIFWPCSR